VDAIRPPTQIVNSGMSDRGVWSSGLPRMAPEALLQRELAEGGPLRTAMALFLQKARITPLVTNPLLMLSPYSGADLSWRNLPGWMMIAPPEETGQR
jgi:hypothetical protein